MQDGMTKPQESHVVEKSEILQILGDLQEFFRQFGTLLSQVWEGEEPSNQAQEILTRHHAAAVDGSGAFLKAGIVLVLLRYLLTHMKQKEITFRLSAEGNALPEEENQQVAELSEFLRSLNAPLETWGARIYEVARRSQAAESTRSHMVLGPIASLLKAIVRQDWEDTDLVMNHINVVTTSRQSNELVEHVAKLVRTIYNSLNELTEDYQIETLSHATQELPDAVEKLNSVIQELEDTANQNLDILEVLNGMVNEDQKKIDEAVQVLEATQTDLEALAAEKPEMAEVIEQTKTQIRKGVTEKLQGCRTGLDQSLEIYMTLFANQSYQDLTGQTLKKVIAFIEGLQYQLIQVITKQTDHQSIVETSIHQPHEDEQGPDAPNRLSQDKVDSLLSEMGF